MAIDYSHARNLTAGEIIAALIRDGFMFRRQVGSHHRYIHPDGRRVTVAFSQPGETFRRKTLKAMLEWQAQWTDEDLRRLKLIK